MFKNDPDQNNDPGADGLNEKELFFLALEIEDPAKRAIWLKEACGGDEGLYQRLEGLLAAEATAGMDFLKPDEDRLGEVVAEIGHELRTEVANPEADTLGDDQDQAATDLPGVDFNEKPGDTIGRYKLLQKIGEGGGGVVYMADQTQPVKRRVALKVIKLGMDTRQVVARFEAERQALAMMEHPNIASILDAGATEGGRPYFVMELVRGVPITTFCDEHKLGTRERLELFLQVCAAVQHAHQKGIIHRDLKPGNVLVTMMEDRPLPKVIDFGIAKATHQDLTEKTLFTQHGNFVGTPTYMSPEQASMTGFDIDTRSDIYSLGVLLYELLAGAPPFDHKSLLSAGYNEMRRIIAEDEPPKPSTRCTETRIQSKTATGSKPMKFHLNPSSLKGELDWVVMKAIEKDRTRRYETPNAFAADVERYLKDEPVQAAAPSSAYKFRKFALRNKTAIGVVAGFVLMLVIAVGVSSWQAVRAIHAGKESEKARREAERARERTEDVLTYLTAVLKSPDPDFDGRKVTVAACLAAAADELEIRFPDQPERQALLRSVVGSTYYSLGLYPEAIELQDAALKHFLESPDSDRVETFDVMHELADSYYAVGRWSESLKLREKVFAFRGKVLGEAHPDTLKSMSELADSYADIGREPEALRMREKELLLSRQTLGEEDPHTLGVMSQLAFSYSSLGRKADSLELHSKVFELSKKTFGAEHARTMSAMGNLAYSYHAAGRSAEALEFREKVLAHHREKFGEEHPSTLFAMHSLGYSYYGVGRRKEALDLREEVLRLRREKLGPVHVRTLRAMRNLSQSYNDMGRQKEALKLAHETLDKFRVALGESEKDTLFATRNLVEILRDSGQLDKAIELSEQGIELHRRKYEGEHPVTLRAIGQLALLYSEAGRHGDALEKGEAVVKGLRRSLGDARPATLEGRARLATIRRNAGQIPAAIEEGVEVLARCHSMLGAEAPRTLEVMRNLALSYSAEELHEEALELGSEVLELFGKVLGEEHPDTLVAMENLAAMTQSSGLQEEAVSILIELLPVARRLLEPSHPLLPVLIEDLADGYEKTGNDKAAQELRSELKELNGKPADE